MVEVRNRWAAGVPVRLIGDRGAIFEADPLVVMAAVKVPPPFGTACTDEHIPISRAAQPTG